MGELNIFDVIALDKVQKGKPLKEDEYKALKAKRLIEGRRPNLYVSAKVAAAIETRADYIKRRAFDKNHYKKMIVEYLEKFTKASRADLDQLLMNKISDALDSSQKKNFITNLLQEMRREGIIEPIGPTRWAEWILSKTPSETPN